MNKLSMLAVMLGCFALSGCSSHQSAARTVETTTTSVASTSAPAVQYATSGATRVNDSTFSAEIANNHGVALVDFGAKWCGPCRRIEPVIDALARDLSGTVKVAKVDCDESPSTSSQYRISGIPCLVLFKDGGEIARTAGYHTKEELKAWIDQHSEAAPAAASVSASN